MTSQYITRFVLHRNGIKCSRKNPQHTSATQIGIATGKRMVLEPVPLCAIEMLIVQPPPGILWVNFATDQISAHRILCSACVILA